MITLWCFTKRLTLNFTRDDFSCFFHFFSDSTTTATKSGAKWSNIKNTQKFNSNTNETRKLQDELNEFMCVRIALVRRVGRCGRWRRERHFVAVVVQFRRNIFQSQVFKWVIKPVNKVIKSLFEQVAAAAGCCRHFFFIRSFRRFVRRVRTVLTAQSKCGRLLLHLLVSQYFNSMKNHETKLATCRSVRLALCLPHFFFGLLIAKWEMSERALVYGSLFSFEQIRWISLHSQYANRYAKFFVCFILTGVEWFYFCCWLFTAVELNVCNRHRNVLHQRKGRNSVGVD